ncbi:MAG TPA: AI-2E family transporter [Candidatus Acidoferrales bacterium]|nr:AI-2E family transporter [Candidatus Acidoferrales bacterium]
MQTIFRKNSFKVFLVIIILLSALWALSFLGGVFALLLLSILMTFLLSPIVELLETKGIRRIYGILMIYSVIGVVVAGLLYTFLPPLFNQIVSLKEAIGSPDFTRKLSAIQSEIQSKISFIDFGNISEKINGAVVQLTSKWFTILTSVGSFLMLLIIVPFVSFFLLKDGEFIIQKFIALVPNRYFEMSLNVVHKIGIQLGKYIRAWFTEAAIVGILSIVGLLVMGVKYAVIIGVAAGIANLIPYLGPIVGAVPAIVVSFVQMGNLNMVLPIVGLFAGIRIIDDIIIVPTVYSHGAEMHPLTIVLLVLIAAELEGIAGMVLAMPLYTVFKVIAKETYWGLTSYRITKSGTNAETVLKLSK